MSGSLHRSWSILLQTVAGASRSLPLLLVSCFWILGSSNLPAIVDTNNNGVSDLWEQEYNNGNLFSETFNPEADPDGDGWTNAQEAAAGTDPFNPNPPDGIIRPDIVRTPAVMGEESGEPVVITPEVVTVSWPTTVGKQYTLLASPDLSEGSWVTVGPPFIGTGSIPEFHFETQPADKRFWRVTVSDIDTDGDGLADAEENEIGSSPYLADTDGDGKNDLDAHLAGQDPRGNGLDHDGDGVPDNEIYSVEFEIQEEGHSIGMGVGVSPLSGSTTMTRYLTRTQSEEYTITDSPRYTATQEGRHDTTLSWLKGGSFQGDSIETQNGAHESDWQDQHAIALGQGETLVTGLTINASGQSTLTADEQSSSYTLTTPWEVKKTGTTVRSGNEVITITNRIKLTVPVTYPQLWTTHFKPWEWSEEIPNKYGPPEISPEALPAVADLAAAAESIRASYRTVDFPVSGTVSLVGGRESSYNHCLGIRLKHVRWRWIRFNPAHPFSREVATPPVSVRKQLSFLITKQDMSGDFTPPLAATIVENPVGVATVVCEGNASGWQDIPLTEFNTHKQEDPTGLATLDFDKCMLTSVNFGNLPVAVAVDADRDGAITFDGKDKTTSQRPFRFWINNDQDDVEQDKPAVVTAVDAYDVAIKTKRDLEDFCRLSIKTGVDLSQLRGGEIKIGLKFRNTSSPAPAIRIWPNQSVEGNLDYLTNVGAAAQILRQSFGETFNTDTVLIPTTYWLTKNDSTAQLIFEGIQGTSGELVVVLLGSSGVELGETAGTWIKLMDVREMYQRARIVNEAEQIPDPWVNSNPPAQAWAWDPNGKPYVEDPAAEAVTAVFVHGWRMPYNCYLNWADTSYKRLWQKGFKGKFYSFRWPTYSADNTVFRNNTFDDWQEMNAPVPPGGFTYNPSEYRAWLCGPALASFVNQLPNPARRNLFAHSMGNVVSGAALRAGMKLTRYAMCNAAVSAMAYDPSQALIPAPTNGLPTNLNTASTPDTDDYLSIRQAYGLANKFNVPSNGTFSMPVVSNFGLPNDAALGQWSSNNEVFRPQIFGLAAGSYNYIALGPSAGRLGFAFDDHGTTVIRNVNAPAEAFAYITKSKTRAAGADLRTRGVIATENVVDMGAAEFNFGDMHSAAWRLNNQSTNVFWQANSSG